MRAVRYILDFEWALGFSDASVRICFLSVFALVLVFALLQNKDYVYQGAPDRARWRDLRLWAAALLAIQAGIYLYF